MLKNLFTSNTRIKLLALFLDNPDGEYFIRELTRVLNEQINSIRRELLNLQKMGLLETVTSNRKKYYRVNKRFILLKELTSIFNKASNNYEPLVKSIAKLGKIELLILTGVFIKKKSQTDLVIVGDLDKDKLTTLLEEYSGDSDAIKFTLLNREDFIYRSKYNDKFLTDIITSDENIIAINKFM